MAEDRRGASQSVAAALAGVGSRGQPEMALSAESSAPRGLPPFEGLGFTGIQLAPMHGRRVMPAPVVSADAWRGETAVGRPGAIVPSGTGAHAAVEAPRTAARPAVAPAPPPRAPAPPAGPVPPPLPARAPTGAVNAIAPPPSPSQLQPPTQPGLAPSTVERRAERLTASNQAVTAAGSAALLKEMIANLAAGGDARQDRGTPLGTQSREITASRGTHPLSRSQLSSLPSPAAPRPATGTGAGALARPVGSPPAPQPPAIPQPATHQAGAPLVGQSAPPPNLAALPASRPAGATLPPAPRPPAGDGSATQPGHAPAAAVPGLTGLGARATPEPPGYTPRATGTGHAALAAPRTAGFSDVPEQTIAAAPQRPAFPASPPPPNIVTAPAPAATAAPLQTIVQAPNAERARSMLESAAVPTANPGASSLPGLDTDFEIPGYRLLRQLGKGGMGEVYLAEKLGSAGVSVRCVVKTIIAQSGNNTQFRELFLNEARIVSQLRHPNIVSVLDVGQAAERLYLAMEWIDGLDVTGLLVRASTRRVDLPLRHILYILRDTLQGLHHAHTAVGSDGTPLRIVHRDISPGNVLISRQGAVKLADFGVALGESARNQGEGKNLAGKPHYFAPELWDAQPASIRTDIFALGVTLYEMMSLRPLFSRDLTMLQVMQEIRRFDPRRLLEDDLTIPEGIEHILLKSLAPRPGDRYGSALEFLEDVNDYAYENGIRLLDAHFASYISRTLDGGARNTGSVPAIG